MDAKLNLEAKLPNRQVPEGRTGHPKSSKGHRVSRI